MDCTSCLAITHPRTKRWVAGMLTDLLEICIPGWTLISYAHEDEEGHKEFPGHIDSKELITHLGATIELLRKLLHFF